MSILRYGKKLAAQGSVLMGGGKGGGGGGGQPVNSTTQTSNIPEYARPYVETMLGTAQQQIFNYDDAGNVSSMKPYTPYSENATDYIAGFSPLQQQAQSNVANMSTSPNYANASNMSTASGLGALSTANPAAQYGGMGANFGANAANLAPEAQQYGQNAADIGAIGGMGYGSMGAQAGQTAADIGTMGGMRYGNQGAQAGQLAGAIGTVGGLGYGAQGMQAGQNAAGFGTLGAEQGLSYGQNATNAGAVQSYMNPYLQATLNPAMQLQAQQFGQINAQNQGQATQQGAFGGGRQAVMQGLNQQNQMLAQNQLVGNAYNQAYNTANQNMQTAAQLGMQGTAQGIQGQQAAMQGAGVGLSGVNAALAGQQANIQGANTGLAGVNAGIAGQNAAMQGAGVGLSGVNAAMQGQQTGLQGLSTANQLYGQGISGANAGLQGVAAQQAAYQQLGAQGANLANIGGQETQSALAINSAQQASGAAQQAQQQNIINQQIQNYATAQQYPMMQLGNMSNLLRGLPMQSTTAQTYQAAPSAVSTLGGLGATALGAYGAAGGFKSAAKGGLMKSYAAGGQVAFDVGGSVTSDLESMDDAHLIQEAKTSPSDQIRQEAIKILTERKMEQQAMGQGVGAATGGMQMAGGGIVAFAGEEGSLVGEGERALSKEAKDYLANKAGKSATTTAVESATPGLMKRLGTGFGAYQLADTGMGFSEGAASALAGPEQSSRREMMLGAGGGDDTALASGILSNADYSKPVPSWIPDWLNPNKMASATPATAPAPAEKPATKPSGEKPGGILGAGAGVGAEDKQYTAQVGKLSKEIDLLTADLHKGLSSGKAQSDLNDLREEIKDKQNQKLWLSLMAGGAKAMSSRSPFANVGIGEGVGAGVETYAQAAKAERDDKKLLIAQQSALEQAEYARKTGNLNALIAAQTRLDTIKMHRDALKAQYAGISASKEATLDASKTKAYGDTILKGMAAGMSEEESTNLANRIYSGKGAALPEGVKVTKLKG